MAQHTRLRWLDIARGVCILCMIITHYYSWNTTVSNFVGIVGLWFLPFFFFSSGLCFRARGSLFQAARRQAQKLLLPYLAVSVPILWYRCTAQGLWPGLTTQQRLRAGLASLVYALPSTLEDVPLFHTDTIGVGPIWFFPCLFFAWLLYRLLYPLRWRLPLAVALAMAASVSQPFVTLPFTLQDACIGCMFLALGDALREKVLAGAARLRRLHPLWLAVLTYLAYLLLVFDLLYLPAQSIDLGSNFYSPLSITGTLLGFGFLTLLSVLCERLGPVGRWLAFCGRESFLIVILHNIDILALRSWAGQSILFCVGTLALYPALVYLFRRVQARLRRRNKVPRRIPRTHR